MTTYVLRDGKLVPKDQAPPQSGVSLWSEIEPYQSPASGKWITSRRERREDLKRTGCVPYERLPGAPEGLTNTRFAHKHGMINRLTPEARERYESEKKEGMWR